MESTRGARLGGRERELDCLLVTHLPHEDDVRVLAQSGAQAVREGRRVPSQLALPHQASPAWMENLNGVFERDHVNASRLGDVGY